MTAVSDETGREPLQSPQHIIEGIILRRLHDKRIEGYTLEMSEEIVAALSAAPVAQEPVATKKVYIKPLRTIVEIQTAYADQIRDWLNTSTPATSAGLGADEIAAYLFARDESYPHEGVTPALMEWGRLQVRAGKDAAHDGDCTKKPFSCVRCAYDIAIRDATAILALLSRGSGSVQK